MPFLETTFVPTPAYGFVGGPEFHTTVVTLASGREQRNIDWANPKHSYSAPFMNITPAMFLEVKRLFMACRGQAYGFRFKDWTDFQAIDEPFGTGDGSTNVFQLTKTSTADSVSYVRTIKKPNSSGFVAKVNGTPVSATVDTTTGLVTFGSPPGGASALTWTGTFDVPVRFAMDSLPFSIDDLNAFNSPSGGIQLVEDPEA